MLAIDTVGTHPSTALCIEALQWLQENGHFAKPPLSVLDMGCGNGILSVIAASAFDADILAVDISEKALADAKIHIVEHRLESRITLIRSDGFAAADIARRAPYDLVISNMLAEFHQRNAADVQKTLISGGYALICGMLVWLADDVKRTYISLGFEILKEFYDNPWAGILLRKL